MAESIDAVLTRLKESERDTLRAEQLAWVGQMAAGVAHEIRNPLMSIRLLVEAAAERADARSFGHEDLQVLGEEIARLEQIVAGFLDFARPPRPDVRIVPVATLLAQAAAGAAARAALQGVVVGVDPPPGPAALRADPGQLQQVLCNLLFNALDALPLGGSVQLSATIEPGAGGSDVVLRVEDDGPGLPPIGDRIFEPFVSTKETGLGLGLSICRRIVEAHGGTIHAASRPAGGAAFSVRLPAAA
jgi:signal transduction histidine kinase